MQSLNFKAAVEAVEAVEKVASKEDAETKKKKNQVQRPHVHLAELQSEGGGVSSRFGAWSSWPLKK